MRKQFDFYAYSSPTCGGYDIDGYDYFGGEDFRNKKRYLEYKNVGFTLLLLQHENSYEGEAFDTSACRLCMTEAAKAGLDKIIVSDARLKALCKEETLVGENGRFQTQEALEAYLDECTAPYRTMKGFYGLQLMDEPKRSQLLSYGQVCKALKKKYPNIYLQCNLLPLTTVNMIGVEGEEQFEAYENYLSAFLEASEMDCILFDEYPFRRSYIIGGHSLRTYQIVARVCKRYGVEFRTVLQSFAMLERATHMVHRPVTERDMYWQTNLAMAFGCREYSFFTYCTKQHNELKGEFFFDGASFINRDGTRSKLYSFTRRIVGEMKKLAPVLLKYRYENNWFAFEEGKGAKDFMQTEFAEINEGCPITVKTSKGVLLVTKHTGENGTLYAVENIGNLKEVFFGNGGEAAVEISLGDGVKKAKFYKRGKRVKRKLSQGSFTETLDIGEAVFIEVENEQIK